MTDSYTEEEKKRALEAREERLYKLLMKPAMSITVWKNGNSNNLMPNKELDVSFEVRVPKIWKDMIEAILPTLDQGDEVIVCVSCGTTTKVKETYRGLQFVGKE